MEGRGNSWELVLFCYCVGHGESNPVMISLSARQPEPRRHMGTKITHRDLY